MLDVLKTRRSVRKYTDEMPRDEDIERIVEAGLYAPTGMGKQGVKFVVVKNKEMRDHLSKLNADVLGSDKDPFYGVIVFLNAPFFKKSLTFFTFKYFFRTMNPARTKS